MIDYKEIRKHIAIENSVLIADDDPVLVSVTLNELIFQRYVDILAEKNDTYRKAIEAALQKGIADAKITSGRVITDGSNYINEQASERVRTVMEEVLTQIKKELLISRNEIHAAKKIAVVAAVVSCFCAVATVAVAINVV